MKKKLLRPIKPSETMNHEAASEIGRAQHEIARKRSSVTQCFETGYKCSTRIYLDKHKAPNHGPFFTVQKNGVA